MPQGMKILPGLLVAAAGWNARGAAQSAPVTTPRVINVVADKDSRFKMAGQSHPEITVKAGEALVLRIEARRGKTWNRDGAIHGFTLLHAKGHAKVPGWDLELRQGKQEFALTAPSQPGEYEVLCTVICSDDHDGMRMKFIVVP